MYHSITAAAAVVNSASKAAVLLGEKKKIFFRTYECCQKKLKTRTLASYEFPRTSVRVYEVRVLSLTLMLLVGGLLLVGVLLRFRVSSGFPGFVFPVSGFLRFRCFVPSAAALE